MHRAPSTRLLTALIVGVLLAACSSASPATDSTDDLTLGPVQPGTVVVDVNSGTASEAFYDLRLCATADGRLETAFGEPGRVLRLDLDDPVRVEVDGIQHPAGSPETVDGVRVVRTTLVSGAPGGGETVTVYLPEGTTAAWDC